MRLPADAVLLVIHAEDPPDCSRQGPSLEAERNIAALVAAWRAEGLPLTHVGRTAFRLLERLPRPLQSVAPQSVKIHPTLEVDIHVAGGRHRAVPLPMWLGAFGSEEMRRGALFKKDLLKNGRSLPRERSQTLLILERTQKTLRRMRASGRSHDKEHSDNVVVLAIGPAVRTPAGPAII